MKDMKTIIIGDIHAKLTQPYRKHIYSFFDWLLENYKDDTVIFLGDVFNSSSPHNDVKTDIIEYLLQFKKVYLLKGNHDYSSPKGLVLSSIQLHDNIEVIEKVTEVNINGNKILFIPYTYNKNEMKEYENLTGKYDYILTHVVPIECQFGEEGIQLNLDGVYIHGHTHIQKTFVDVNSRDHFVIGVPLPTRHLEDKQEHKIFEIQEDGGRKTVKVPFFFKYEDVEFGDEPESKDNILNILNAPDNSAVIKRYKDCYVRFSGVKLQLSDEEGNEEIILNGDDLINKFIQWVASEELVPESIKNTGIDFLEKAKVISSAIED